MPNAKQAILHKNENTMNTFNAFTILSASTLSRTTNGLSINCRITG